MRPKATKMTQTENRFRRASLLIVITSAALLSASTPSRAADKPNEAAPKAGEGKAAARALCDDNWEGGFMTIAVDRTKNEEKKVLFKDYDPSKPEEPWFAPEGRYTRLGYFSNVERRNQGLPADQVVKLIGRFYDQKKADAFLKRVYADSKFSRHFNPRFPPDVVSTGALLVSEKFSCTIQKENDTLAKADWIVEVDGHLFAGKEFACSQGKTRKTISIVDCEGKKVLATDTWSSPCDGTRVGTCLFPMSPGVVGIQQDYSASGEGRQLSFRGYELAKGHKVFDVKEGYDSTGYDDVTDIEDVDGDGVPELVGRHCEGDNCHRTRLRKWNGKRFTDVKFDK
jgi:hypothetical protein